MKRGMVLFLLAAVLLTVPVFADFGPKPQLIVRVENGPEELYYLDILKEGKNPYSETTVGGLKDKLYRGGACRPGSGASGGFYRRRSGGLVCLCRPGHDGVGKH